MVMHHGFARNAGFWRRWVPALAAGRRVYRPEVRGFGRSDVPPEDYRCCAHCRPQVSDLRKVVDNFGIRRKPTSSGSRAAEYSTFSSPSSNPQRVRSLGRWRAIRRMGGSHSVRSAYALGEDRPGAAMLKLGLEEWCRRTLSYRLDVEKASPELQNWYATEIGKTPARVAANVE